MLAIRKLAPKPALTPAKAAASPASGWRPSARKIAAPSGIRITYPASEATWETIPASTTAAVIRRRGALITSARMSTARRPEPSATPIPTIATSTSPSGGKRTKFSTTFSKSQRIPSPESRLRTSIRSPVPGWVAPTPAAVATAERRITPSARSAKRVAGCGRALPIASTRSSRRKKRLFPGFLTRFAIALLLGFAPRTARRPCGW